MTFKLTESQQKSKEEILQTINAPKLTDDDRFHTLSGSAGSGKSTVIVDIIKSIPPHLSIGLTGLTHKAVKVLADMAKEQGILERVETRTIHSALGLKMVNYGTQVKLEKDRFNKGHYYDVLFIDEASQASDTIIGYVLEHEAKAVIFIGDPCQAEPVDDHTNGISSVFTVINKQARLTEVVRCALDNPIINLAEQLRKCQDSPNLYLPKIKEVVKDGCGIYVKQEREFFNSFLQKVKSKEFKNTDFARCVAHTNNIINNGNNILGVNQINEWVRQQLHGYDVPEFIKGETIIAQESTLEYRNSDEFIIHEVEEDHCSEFTPEPIAVWRLNLYSLYTKLYYDAVVPKAEALPYLEHHMATLVKRARSDKNNASRIWKEYYKVKDGYNNFKHIYAITTYKSQGSSYNHTYVFTPNFLQFDLDLSIKRLLYTATTRSSQSTTFCSMG